MKNKKSVISISILICLIISFLSGCSAVGGKNKTGDTKFPLVTEMADEATINEVTGLMANAGLSNVDLFREWVSDFSKSAGEKASLTKGWVPPSEIKSDIYACMDGWENNHDFSDADCRMTAFLLLDGIITAEKTEDYNGTYLMFDVEAIDNVDKYAAIKNNKALFTTLFGEYSFKESKKPEEVFSKMWQDHGFSIDNNKISLISVVITDRQSEVVFVGHTGVLLNFDDYMLFIEKLAFEQPYRVTKVNSIDQLTEIFNSRLEYFESEDRTGTFFYQNGTLISKEK